MDRTVHRLMPVIPFLVDFKLRAVEEWRKEHSYESRSDQTRRTINGYVYDRAYGFARRERNYPIMVNVEGSWGQQVVMVRDDKGPPIAVWMKSARRNSLQTANYWTSRTRKLRATSTLFDHAEKPELVICAHTLFVADTVEATVEIEDIYLTREISHGSHAADRDVIRLDQLYSHRHGLIAGMTHEQPNLFVTPPDPIVIVVKPRAPAPVERGPQMPTIHPEPQSVEEPLESQKQKKRRKSKGA